MRWVAWAALAGACLACQALSGVDELEFVESGDASVSGGATGATGGAGGNAGGSSAGGGSGGSGGLAGGGAATGGVAGDGGVANAGGGGSIKCASYVYGFVESSGVLVCTALLAGTAATPEECPKTPGNSLNVSCHGSCIDDTTSCAPYAPASGVTLSSACVTDAPTPKCSALCDANGEKLNHYSCDAAGSCVLKGGLTDCTPYKCATTSCLSWCDNNAQCAPGHYCDTFKECSEQ
jgi:hypothetical protein